jgi:hypothetical protein
MVRKLSKNLFVLLVFIMIFFPDISFAFNSDTRCQIVKDAVNFSPKYLRSYLTTNFTAVHEGIHFVDRNKKAVSSIRTKNSKRLYNRIVKDLRKNKVDNFRMPNRFGLLACYIAETIYSDDFIDRVSLIPKKVVYDGFHEVSNVDASLSNLIVKYRKPYGHSRDKRVTDYLYNVAVNQIVDHWVSAWQQGGKKPGLLTRRGSKISHENMVIYNLKLRG